MLLAEIVRETIWLSWDKEAACHLQGTLENYCWELYHLLFCIPFYFHSIYQVPWYELSTYTAAKDALPPDHLLLQCLCQLPVCVECNYWEFAADIYGSLRLALLMLSWDKFMVNQPWVSNVASDWLAALLAANQKLYLKIVVSYPCFILAYRL